jgi:hypothetical protein
MSDKELLDWCGAQPQVTLVKEAGEVRVGVLVRAEPASSGLTWVWGRSSTLRGALRGLIQSVRGEL